MRFTRIRSVKEKTAAKNLPDIFANSSAFAAPQLAATVDRCLFET